MELGVQEISPEAPHQPLLKSTGGQTYVGDNLGTVSTPNLYSELPLDQDQRGDIGITRSAFLTFRSLVGIGVLAMPLATQTFGIVSTIIFLPVFAVIILYVLDLVLVMAEHLNFHGSKYSLH